MHNEVSRQQVFSLKHQAVRDLAWSVWGPDFFSADHTCIEKPSPFPLDWHWLQALDRQPEGLIHYLSAQNTRLLGTYFEALWQFFLSHHPCIQHYCFNVQVNDEKRTLGEFDCLVIDQRGEVYHIELACKFYLQYDDQGNPLWIGPNCGDRLDIKYNKTYDKQLPLLFSKLGWYCFQHVFSDYDLASDQTNQSSIHQLAIWRGMPFQQNQWLRGTDQELNAINFKDTKDREKSSLWFIADKSFWLSPVVINQREKLKDFTHIKQQIEQHFESKKFTLMLIELIYCPQQKHWQQVQQYFITPPNWPYGKYSDNSLTPLRPCRPPL